VGKHVLAWVWWAPGCASKGGIHQFSGESRLSRFLKITTGVELSGSFNSPIQVEKRDLSRDFSLSRAFQ
jgi:hypothetical protein